MLADGMDSWCPTAMHSQDGGCLDGEGDFSRNGMDSIVSKQDLTDYFLAPFAASIIKANARSIMASENAINGQACSTTTLLKDVVRDQYNFTGFITSDW